MATPSSGPSFDHDRLGAGEQEPETSPSFDEPEYPPGDREADFLIGDDDSRWDVFLPDDNEIDLLPEPGDFWFDDD